MMRKFLPALCLGLALNLDASAQLPYVCTPDPNHPEQNMLTGIITKYSLQNLPGYAWFESNKKGYTPEATVVQAMENAKDKISFIVFGGTWCDDTRYILPKFFLLQEMSGFPDNRISFFGVNRAKETPGNITRALGITNVPTIIVMKDGKELGRVVEYGKTGKWDKELAEIIQSAK